jgi:hypothetical protein
VNLSSNQTAQRFLDATTSPLLSQGSENIIVTPQAAAAAGLSLLWLAGLSHASYDCDPSAGLCLTTFRWCNPDSCQYPENVKLLSDSGPVAYGMLRYDETYYVNWTTPSAKDEVFLTWYIPQFGSDDPPPLEWTRSECTNSP